MAKKKEYSLIDGSAKAHNQNVHNHIHNHIHNHSTNDLSNNKQNNKRKLAVHKQKESPAAGSSNRNVYDVSELRAQLGSYGLTVRDIPGDGNCLFRALGDQLDGHTLNHLKHRLETVRYMIAHRAHFEPFLDVPFDRYVDELSRPGTYAGQDALVAFARLHKVNILIHQLNRPVWQIQGCENENAPELHLSYHNGEHYSSVRRFGDFDNTPAGIRILAKTTTVPCCASHNSVCTAATPVTSFADLSSVQNSFMKPPAQSVLLDSTTIDYLGNDEFELLIRQVMMESGCRDREMVTDVLVDKGGDVIQAIDYLVSLTFYIDQPNNEQLTDQLRVSKENSENHFDNMEENLAERLLNAESMKSNQKKIKKLNKKIYESNSAVWDRSKTEDRVEKDLRFHTL